MDIWYDELVENRGLKIPIILVANKIDMDPSRATKSFAFVQKKIQERGGNPDDFPLYFVSASDGSNVVSIFQHAILKAVRFKKEIAGGETDNFIDQVMGLINEEQPRSNGISSK